MVSRSHSGRWVIYERRGRPCLIDAKNGTEELLGSGNSADFMPSSGNAEVAPSAVWHRRKDKVVLDMVQGRKLALLWVWSHDKGLRQFEEEELLKSLGVAPGRIHSGGGFFTADFAWKGDDLHFHLRYTIHQGDDFVEHDARLRWDFTTDRLHLLSDNVQR